MTPAQQRVFEKIQQHYRSIGYVEEHVSHGEYLLMINPSTMAKVRISYHNPHPIESGLQ